MYSASGDGKIPYVDLRDVAAVALVTLTQLGHLGKTYVVTGSEALSYREAAAIISAEIGKPLCFIDGTQDEARERRIREGLPAAVIESALAISAYQRAGGKTVTITTTGRRPHWPGAPEHSPNSLTKMLRSSVVRHRGCCVVG